MLPAHKRTTPPGEKARIDPLKSCGGTEGGSLLPSAQECPGAAAVKKMCTTTISRSQWCLAGMPWARTCLSSLRWPDTRLKGCGMDYMRDRYHISQTRTAFIRASSRTLGKSLKVPTKAYSEVSLNICRFGSIFRPQVWFPWY